MYRTRPSPCHGCVCVRVNRVVGSSTAPVSTTIHVRPPNRSIAAPRHALASRHRRPTPRLVACQRKRDALERQRLLNAGSRGQNQTIGTTVQRYCRLRCILSDTRRPGGGTDTSHSAPQRKESPLDRARPAFSHSCDDRASAARLNTGLAFPSDKRSGVARSRAALKESGTCARFRPCRPMRQGSLHSRRQPPPFDL